MISHLSGTLLFRTSRYIVIDVGGVGYKIFISSETQKLLPQKGGQIGLFTHLYVRESALELYGFPTMAELEFFEMLIAISGIGPRSAIGILSVAPLDLLKRAIASGETAYLTKVSGIGKKIAEKIMIELRDKLAGEGGDAGAGGFSDALDALVSLGYSTKEAREALQKTSKDAETLDQKIKEALQILGQYHA
ncbi:MAG: Holliday junction DNA helicase RuvA [Candidatus Ryanbacteria bacterium RIFCSPHIGHO2_12_FULL_47_12b]|uniref:Holliday junction branch migration complex subunit RuvA n=1 Tax=Candidatus Ryanbacteria bacterium RIFCSPLOWO2_02_FULL_47_14 TaxID=1802129 RepID=A0A1G2H1E3_9BACT|nr:MAG: Holliday junction ATP-dependent DNA helicase RuvA [Parcubacteria group bacterium GW2011_GWA2_47_10b]OGZ52135.1 MAG: Holliday junction DNA helicase RuvA [Candidatus Ryanbacteria bacterium RIFCSPHIGHO2_12_FULL_47_12b]OGZ56284.1 MAG: Holliday junction DNA helicase RuvA [Candidatus Ryanbacteria bacterium RIFCSPLOWO2_02_FULL_47_14]